MFEGNTMMFVENDRQNLPSRPLYMTASIRDVELKGAMVDPGCSVNIIHLSILEAASVSRDRITKQLMIGFIHAFRGLFVNMNMVFYMLFFIGSFVSHHHLLWNNLSFFVCMTTPN